MRSKTLDALNKLTACLPLERKPVGIKFLFTKEDYDAFPAPVAKAKMAYCVMVKIAGNGACLKADLPLFGCGGGTRALGLEDASPTFGTGEEYHGFGLYSDLAVARGVADQVTLCRHRIHGVAVQPLEAYTSCDPDVVILVVNSFAAMRIIQGYTYQYGTQTQFKLAGNQAVCSECTAYPFESNSINLSMFCSGTRYLAGWRETEIGMGLPYGRFLGTCEGVYRSANGAEQDWRKEGILQNLAQAGLPDPGLEMGGGYFYQE